MATLDESRQYVQSVERLLERLEQRWARADSEWHKLDARLRDEVGVLWANMVRRVRQELDRLRDLVDEDGRLKPGRTPLQLRQIVANATRHIIAFEQAVDSGLPISRALRDAYELARADGEALLSTLADFRIEPEAFFTSDPEPMFAAFEFEKILVKGAGRAQQQAIAYLTAELVETLGAMETRGLYAPLERVLDTIAYRATRPLAWRVNHVMTVARSELTRVYTQTLTDASTRAGFRLFKHIGPIDPRNAVDIVKANKRGLIDPRWSGMGSRDFIGKVLHERQWTLVSPLWNRYGLHYQERGTFIPVPPTEAYIEEWRKSEKALGLEPIDEQEVLAPVAAWFGTPEPGPKRRKEKRPNLDRPPVAIGARQWSTDDIELAYATPRVTKRTVDSIARRYGLPPDTVRTLLTGDPAQIRDVISRADWFSRAMDDTVPEEERAQLLREAKELRVLVERVRLLVEQHDRDAVELNKLTRKVRKLATDYVAGKISRQKLLNEVVPLAPHIDRLEYDIQRSSVPLRALSSLFEPPPGVRFNVEVSEELAHPDRRHTYRSLALTAELVYRVGTRRTRLVQENQPGRAYAHAHGDTDMIVVWSELHEPYVGFHEVGHHVEWSLTRHIRGLSAKYIEWRVGPDTYFYGDGELAPMGPDDYWQLALTEMASSAHRQPEAFADRLDTIKRKQQPFVVFSYWSKTYPHGLTELHSMTIEWYSRDPLGLIEHRPDALASVMGQWLLHNIHVHQQGVQSIQP